jgi:hypothetical protein
MKTLKNILTLLFFLFSINLWCQPYSHNLKIYENYKNAFENKSVRIIYLVSSDRIINNEYLDGIKRAALSVQKFYEKELNGLTFKLNNPVVEILKSDKKAIYFYSNPCDNDPDNWGYFNAYNEVSRLLGAKFNGENYTWVIYSDGPGDKGRGGAGVCVMPEDDLKGLIGKHPTQPDVNRWIGGLAHELGHAFGLNHPSSPEEHPKAIMWTGIYGYYPHEAYLTQDDKIILHGSSFFNNEKKLEIKYPEGSFEGSDEINSEWTEYKSSGSAQYFFKLIELNNDFKIIKSNDRNLLIKLPSKNGLSYISLDNGENWQKWWLINY